MWVAIVAQGIDITFCGAHQTEQAAVQAALRCMDNKGFIYSPKNTAGYFEDDFGMSSAEYSLRRDNITTRRQLSNFVKNWENSYYKENSKYGWNYLVRVT